MKNKKGFTLIELLAVIVILAIIALIATPIILNMIENAKKGAAKDSAYGYIEAIEKNNALADVSENYTKIEDGNNINIKTIYIKVKGKLPKDGIVTLKKGVVKNATLCINEYYVFYNGQTAEITEPCDESNIKEIATFDGNGGPDGESILKKEGEELGTLPAITREGYEFLGWFTEKENGTQITETTKMPSGGTIYYAQWMEIKHLCIRATTLHEETCNRTSNGCYVAGYTSDNKGTTITYGNKNVTPKTLNSGDAFDCDVNGDDVYDPENERFYYVSDYYDTSTETFESDTAVLIYYNNTKEGVANNSAAMSRGGSSNGPSATAMKYLPTVDMWSNINLKNTSRTILSQTPNIIKSNFSYDGYATRFLTYQEVVSACGYYELSGWPTYKLDNCEYLLENTNYVDSKYVTYSMETILDSNRTHYLIIDGVQSRLFYGYYGYANYTVSSSDYIGVRPVIEIPKKDIDY